MAPGFNVTVVGAEVEKALKSIERELPIGVELGKVSDQAQVVSKSVSEFLRSLAEAVGIVLIVSFLTLGLRAGLVVALTIPLVLAATFFVMQAMGIDLHRISLGALIIALGLLVDDAMIAVEMMDRKLQEGYDKLSAATFAYTSTAFPMLTGTLITVAGFIPVGFAASQAGEYVSALFWVTGISLVISWFAAVYFTPWIGYRLLKARRGAGITARPSTPSPSASSAPSSPGACAGARRWWSRPSVRWPRASPASPSSRSSSSPPPTGPRSWSICGCPRAPRSPIPSGRPRRSRRGCCRTRTSPRSLCRRLRRRGRAALLPAARPAAQEPELRPAHAHVQVAGGARAGAAQGARDPEPGLPQHPRQGRAPVQRPARGLGGAGARHRPRARRGAPRRRRDRAR